MPIEYSNPFTAFSHGLRETLLRQEEQRRRDEADQLARDREARLKDHDAAQLEIAKLNAKSLDATRRATEETRATGRAKTISDTLTPGVVVDDPTYEDLQAGGLGGLVDTSGESVVGTLQDVDASGNPVGPADIQNIGPRTYKGTQAQQKTEQEKAVFQSILDDPNATPEAKLAATFALGGRATPAELLKGNNTQALFRTSANRRTIERFEGGQWVPHTGEIPKDAHWLQEPQPPITVRTDSGLTVNNEANLVMRMQQAWSRTIAAEKEMNRQFIIMNTALQRFDKDPVGGSEGVRVTFEKILDPISVVREGEYARQGEGLALIQKLEGFKQRYLTGGGIVPAHVLKEMVETARQFKEGLQNFHAMERNRLELTADRYQIPRSLVFGEAPPSVPGVVAPGAPPTTPSADSAGPRVRTFNPATGKLE